MYKFGWFSFIAALSIILSASTNLYGQDQQILLSHLQGDTLLAKLVEDYKPAQVMTYKAAREAMYTEIDNENNSLSGIYTDYTIDLDQNALQPITLALNDGINCEHSYPQSKGADEEPAKSNIHHLFPSKINVNSDRGSCPFDEIVDSQTQSWYFEDTILDDIPSSNIDAYSEKDIAGSQCGSFEPREDVKGDIARAQFYFYTMYRAEADAADPDFFHQQKDILLEWAYLDPVDEKEYERTFAIASYQDDLPNPFVLDSTLARRAYFLPDLVLSTEDDYAVSKIEVYPNPNQENFLFLDFEYHSKYRLEVFNSSGALIERLDMESYKGTNNISIIHWSAGVYFLKFIDKGSGEYIGSTQFVRH